MSSLSQILQDNEREVELVDESGSANQSQTDVPSGFWEQKQNVIEEDEASRAESLEASHVSDAPDSDSDHGSESNDKNIFVLLTNNDKSPTKKAQPVVTPRKPYAKVVPLPVPPKKGVKFQTDDEQQTEPSDSEHTQQEESESSASEDDSEQEEDIKEVNVSDSEDSPSNELEALVKQLVLLENEASKAEQFLTFIQKHSCFDKQDFKTVQQFLELIEQEKKSLILVLSNFSSNMQPLITMMTIAERRLSLLDSTNLITPGSSLHAAFLEKQRLLQDVIEQATAHVYGQR